jgi:hypothetical protein
LRPLGAHTCRRQSESLPPNQGVDRKPLRFALRPPDVLRLPEKPLERVHDWLLGSPTSFVALALATGAGAGLGAVLFRYLILWFILFFSGHAD